MGVQGRAGVALGLVAVCVVAACGGSPATATGTDTGTGATAAPFAETVEWTKLEPFESVRFSDPTTVDNTWFPLVPGTQFVYEGFTEQLDQPRTPHRLVITVSDMTKEVMGVRSVVLWDQDFEAGVLVEAELALFAQADDGNVWHFGQYPEVYDARGKVIENPTWIAGIAGAAPGLTIRETPELGGPSYAQGWAPTIPWTDRARIGQVGVRDCVPELCYEGGIVAEEFSREEPDAFQLKYYAPGVGNTRVDFTGKDATRETLELVDVVRLDEAGLADVRAEVQELERSAYDRSRAVYALTTPAVPDPART